jgi:hypothetical protein
MVLGPLKGKMFGSGSAEAAVVMRPVSANMAMRVVVRIFICFICVLLACLCAGA